MTRRKQRHEPFFKPDFKKCRIRTLIIIHRCKQSISHFGSNQICPAKLLPCNFAKDFFAAGSVAVFPVIIGIRACFIHINTHIVRNFCKLRLIFRYFFRVLLLVTARFFFTCNLQPFECFADSLIATAECVRDFLLCVVRMFLYVSPQFRRVNFLEAPLERLIGHIACCLILRNPSLNGGLAYIENFSRFGECVAAFFIMPDCCHSQIHTIRHAYPILSTLQYSIFVICSQVGLLYSDYNT